MNITIRPSCGRLSPLGQRNSGLKYIKDSFILMVKQEAEMKYLQREKEGLSQSLNDDTFRSVHNVLNGLE